MGSSSQLRTESTRKDSSQTPLPPSFRVSSRTLHHLSSVFRMLKRPAHLSQSPRKCLLPRRTRNSDLRESTNTTTERESEEQSWKPRKRSEQPLEKEVQPGHNRLIHFYKVIHLFSHQALSF